MKFAAFMHRDGLRRYFTFGTIQRIHNGFISKNGNNAISPKISRDPSSSSFSSSSSLPHPLYSPPSPLSESLLLLFTRLVLFVFFLLLLSLLVFVFLFNYLSSLLLLFALGPFHCA